MRHDAIDLSRVPARHDEIDRRLSDWAKWVRWTPQAWKAPSIWKNYRSHAWQWERPEVRAQLNTLECAEIERAVGMLPEKHRTAVRWCYVWPYVPDGAVRRDLGVTRAALAQLIQDGRDMLRNRLRDKLLDRD